MKRILLLLLVITAVLGVFSACSSAPYDYELSEYISLPENWREVELTDTAIKLRVSEKLRDLTRLHATEKEAVGLPASIGDKVTLSFECYKATEYGKEDIAPIEELSDSNMTLILGNLKYPYEFEEAVKGHYINDTFQARFQLSSDIGLKEYASEFVVYDVTVLSITKIVKPETDDSFISSVTDYATLEEYKEYLAELCRKELIFEKLLEKAEVIKYPESEVSAYERNYIDYYSSAAQNSGVTLEKYVASKFFISLSDFHKEASAYAKESVKKDLLLYHLVRICNLAPTDDEYNSQAERLASEHGFSSVGALETNFGENFIRKTVSYNKLLDYLGKNVTSPTSDTTVSQ